VSDGDETVESYRKRIAAADRALVEALNARIGLVAELKAYKEARGIAFLDPDRERALLRALQEANPGPLSEDGLRDLVEHVLALTKRELG
jgi:chorismate mutase